MGATASLWGTTRAQYDVRKMCVYLNMFPLNKPEVLIAQAQSKFDAELKLTDKTTRELISQLMVALRDWARRLRPA
jgi:chromate reductase